MGTGIKDGCHRPRECVCFILALLLLTTFVVARMGKEKKWQDVRLLSFDLQTVEFAYAGVGVSLIVICIGDLKSLQGLHSFYQLYGPTVSDWRILRIALFPQCRRISSNTSFVACTATCFIPISTYANKSP